MVPFRLTRLALWSLLSSACAAANSDGATGSGGSGTLPTFTDPLNPAPGAVNGTGGASNGNPGSVLPSNGGTNSNPVGAAGNPAGVAGTSGGSSSEVNNPGPLDPGSGGSSDNGSGNSGGSSANPDDGDPDDPEDPPGSGNGGFVSVERNGGASAAFVCPEGVTFGNPLAGMGSVTTVNPPNGDFFAFIEGPVWVDSIDRLFFNDIARQPERMYELLAPFTTPELAMEASNSNGLAIDGQDQLVMADQRNRRIVRVNPSSLEVTDVIVPTQNFTPNDLIVRSDDNIYFTDPQSGGRGFYRVSPSGQLSGPFTNANANGAPSSPNGIVLSPDENTLYIGDVNARFVAAFSLFVDGSVDTSSGRRFTDTMNGTVDGMAVDCAGNVYASTSNGVEVYSPSAQYLGTVPTGEASNVTFGGPDRRTLFATCRGVLKHVTLAVPGLPN